MKRQSVVRLNGAFVILGLSLGVTGGIAAPPQPPTPKAAPKPATVPPGMMVLPIKLPPMPFYSGPMPMPPVPGHGNKRRGPFLVPRGTKLLSPGKPVMSSDEHPTIGTLSVVTDGEKAALDGNWVELAQGRQWVQIDLKKSYAIYAIVVWHYWGEARIYNDMAVQLADDPNFITNVRTVFNTDLTNKAGLGLGKDRQYFETNEGKLIPVAGLKARYVRLYSNGNSSNDQNHYTEVEVWGKAATKPPPAPAIRRVPAVRLPHVEGIRQSPAVIPAWSTVDRKTVGQRRGPFVPPRGTRLLSRGKPVTSSDAHFIIGTLRVITDGEKSALDGNWVELAPGLQWVQIDLQQPYSAYAILVWHYHERLRIYKDVIVQVADNAEFTDNVRTLYNNDQQNEAGLGAGQDRQYFETNEGKLILGHDVKARYVRLYSHGNSSDDQNHYTEPEVWGK